MDALKIMETLEELNASGEGFHPDGFIRGGFFYQVCGDEDGGPGPVLLTESAKRLIAMEELLEEAEGNGCASDLNADTPEATPQEGE